MVYQKKKDRTSVIFTNYLIFQQILILVGRTEAKKVCHEI